MNRAQAMERIKARRSRAEYQANHRRSQLMEGDAVCRRLMEERAQACLLYTSRCPRLDRIRRLR